MFSIFKGWRIFQKTVITRQQALQFNLGAAATVVSYSSVCLSQFLLLFLRLPVYLSCFLCDGKVFCSYNFWAKKKKKKPPQTPQFRNKKQIFIFLEQKGQMMGTYSHNIIMNLLIILLSESLISSPILIFHIFLPTSKHLQKQNKTHRHHND